ncbi:hypothetical protein Tco_1471053, partial [Tanacetum coccineum]
HKMMYAELVETIETSSDEDGEGDSEHDSEYGHFDANDIIDEEHLVDEVEVNMKDDLEVLDYDLLERYQEDIPAKMLGFPYAGRFTDSPNKHYVDGFEDDDVINLYYKIPLKSLDTGLRPLVSENDTSSFLGYVHKHKMMYAELVETIETSSDEDGEGDSEHDSEYGHFDANDIIDEEHLVDEVEVNMKDDLEVLDYDLLEVIKRIVPAKKCRRKEFENRDLAKERIRAYSVETRRNIDFKRNAKRRIRAVCKGVVPSITGKNVFVDKDEGPEEDISRKVKEVNEDAEEEKNVVLGLDLRKRNQGVGNGFVKISAI